jgi:hypothetical protein
MLSISFVFTLGISFLIFIANSASVRSLRAVPEGLWEIQRHEAIKKRQPQKPHAPHTLRRSMVNTSPRNTAKSGRRIANRD